MRIKIVIEKNLFFSIFLFLSEISFSILLPTMDTAIVESHSAHSGNKIGFSLMRENRGRKSALKIGSMLILHSFSAIINSQAHKFSI